jgi:hypothetical protein
MHVTENDPISSQTQTLPLFVLASNPCNYHDHEIYPKSLKAFLKIFRIVSSFKSL